MTNQKLIELAKSACERSYSPYSNFPVGCAILLKNGKVVLGTNVENASFGNTICAEKNAMTSLISMGIAPSEISKIAVIAEIDIAISPCGMCRQFLSEFITDDVEILLACKKGEYISKTISELLPYTFAKGDLDRV
ncbi:MAG: cytidine deaminase [Mycoplasmatales bacterium]